MDWGAGAAPNQAECRAVAVQWQVLSLSTVLHRVVIRIVDGVMVVRDAPSVTQIVVVWCDCGLVHVTVTVWCCAVTVCAVWCM